MLLYGSKHIRHHEGNVYLLRTNYLFKQSQHKEYLLVPHETC